MVISLIVLLLTALAAEAFVVSPASFGLTRSYNKIAPSPLAMSSFEGDFLQETPEATQERIQLLVDENPVVLFMKGSKLFPQCGFSNTVCEDGVRVVKVLSGRFM